MSVAASPAPLVGWFEPWGGTFACGLAVVADDAPRLVGYAGNKYALRRSILRAAGVRPGQGARLRYCDAGDWGLAWRVLRHPERARAVAAHLRAAGERLDELWPSMNVSPFRDPVRRTAQFLVLQARTVDGVATWWDSARGCWVMGDVASRANAKPVVQRGVWARAPSRSTGLVHTSTLARRLDELAVALEGVDFEVVHGDALRSALPEDLTGWVAYLDPPYRGRTSYVRGVTRRRLIGFALRLLGRGARVLVSEAEPLAIPTWTSFCIGPGEWLTCSFEPSWQPARQLTLAGELVPAPSRARRAPAKQLVVAPSLQAEVGVQLALFGGAACRS